MTVGIELFEHLDAVEIRIKGRHGENIAKTIDERDETEEPVLRKRGRPRKTEE